MVLEILFETDRRALEKLIEKKEHKEQVIDSQIEECDKKVFHKCNKRSAKRYNMTQTARILGVHRETLYYWIKKGWVKPWRDIRKYPVFTVFDIPLIDSVNWHNILWSNDL